MSVNWISNNLETFIGIKSFHDIHDIILYLKMKVQLKLL